MKWIVPVGETTADVWLVDGVTVVEFDPVAYMANHGAVVAKIAELVGIPSFISSMVAGEVPTTAQLASGPVDTRAGRVGLTSYPDGRRCVQIRCQLDRDRFDRLVSSAIPQGT